jgi:acyl carrier protein
LSDDIRNRIVKIVCERLSVSADKVQDSTDFINDLGADSLDTVELIMHFEEEFGVEIPEDDAQKIKTLGDALAYIKTKV